MELKTIEEKKDKLVFEVVGASHTICNLLKKELWNDKHVKSVGYAMKHPLTGTPEFVLETKDDESPRKVVSSACQRIKKELDQFADEFKSEVK